MSTCDDRRGVRPFAFMALIVASLSAITFGIGPVMAQTALVAQATPDPKPSAPVTPVPMTAAPMTPAPMTPAPMTPAPATPNAVPPPAAVPAPDPKAPLGTDTAPPAKTQIENNAAPGIPDNATTENVEVPPRIIVTISGQSSYDDAFKSIKASIDTVSAAISKAGLTANGHPITIFSEPDENGFKYQAAIPVTAKPSGKADLGNGVTIATSPAGKAIKFQHRGAYDDIDSTYDVITAYLDAKGLQVDNPYIEEYLTDLKTADDPNLQVDIYVFMK